MIVRNYTPFVPLLFQSRGVDQRDFWTMVLRGTFQIVPHAPLLPDPEQQPIVEADVFHGEPSASSVRFESDLAPFKPSSDILINAVARAPGGYEAPDWIVRARVGALEKALRVTGPRRWVKVRGAWQLTDPEPCVEVPVRYEHAFGGVWSNAWGDVAVCEENPIGVGFVKAGEEPPGDELPAPRIEAPDDPVEEVGRAHRPEGLGAITRSWLPRRARAGTFDEAWQRERWPDLPLDFQFTFYNAAGPGLGYPGYLRGDEAIELVNLSADPELRFSLPAYTVGVLLRFEAGALVPLPAQLDTVTLDVPEARAVLVWRALFPALDRIRVIEVRMQHPGVRHAH